LDAVSLAGWPFEFCREEDGIEKERAFAEATRWGMSSVGAVARLISSTAFIRTAVSRYAACDTCRMRDA
jgi:hypothetical protein